MDMLRLLGLSAIALLPLCMCSCARSTATAESSPPSADEFLASQRLGEVPEVYRRALEAFLTGEHLYRRGEYGSSRELLERLWADFPPGGDAWADCNRFGIRTCKEQGTNVGLPPCYYALRMLTDCVAWRLAEKAKGGASDAARPAATLTVVLVGRAKGVQPANWDELNGGTGREVELEIDSQLLADGNRVIHDSTWLFSEYVKAMTDGALGMRTRVVHLPGLAVPVRARAKPHRFAGLDYRDAWPAIWAAVGREVTDTTDWWWVLYPSFVPEQYPDFTTTEFITGGMGGGPNRGSPCFIIDDRWLTRKPPHLGRGPYTDIERRAYLPQWLQHEFFHHLFARYPEFGLEAESHQWFDRKSWPEDFVGRFEPDYFHEALHKRLKTRARIALHARLRYTAPPRELFRSIAVESLVGSYRRRPVENDWHEGRIERAGERGPDGTPALRWRNSAGRSWKLIPDPARGVLRTGSDNPYYAPGDPGRSTFQIELRRDATGEWTSELAGFVFQGDLYERTGD